MKKYFFPKRLLALVLIIFSLYSCKKNVTTSSNNPPSGSDSLIKTPVGTPVGNPVTATIGAAGGEMISDDGIMTLTIPAGALTNDKIISIQRITNEIPGGVGFAYDLLPSGTVFNKPANIKFHYNTEDLNGGPFSLFIAFQDSAQEWLVDADHFCNFDTTASTIGLDIWHFSDFVVSDKITITAEALKLKAGETSEIKLMEILLDQNHPGVIHTEGSPAINYEGLTARIVPYPDASILFWRTNASNSLETGGIGGTIGGNDQDGHIIGTGYKVTYQAPAHIDYARKVRVSCRYKTDYRTIFILNEKSEGPINERWVEITLETDEPGVFYHVTIDYNWKGISPFNPATMKDIPTYSDWATMDLFIKFGTNLQITVTPSSIRNHYPQVLPEAKFFDNLKFVWIPDSIGLVNIDQVIAAPLMGPDSTIGFYLQHIKTISPGYTLEYTGQPKTIVQPTPLGSVGYPQDFTLDLKRKEYSYSPGINTMVTFKPQ